MRLVENSSGLRCLLDATWQDRDLQRIPQALARRMVLVASFRELGGGREARSAAQAATLLGSQRVQHIALWHVVLSSMNPAAATELAHSAGHALFLAPRHGLRPAAAVTRGLGACLGWQLLTAEAALSEPLQRVLRDAGPNERAMLEHMVFGRTSEDAIQAFVGEHHIPESMAELLRPVAGSPGQSFREAVRASLRQGSTGEVSAHVALFAEAMDMRLEPWVAPAAPTPRDVAMAMAELVKDRNGAMAQVAGLKSRIEELERELDVALNPPRKMMGPAATHSAMKREFDRARRYKREVAVIALGVDPGAYPVPAEEVLAEIGRRVEAAFRGSDFVGMVDSRTLAIVLPETNLGGARIFAERVEHGLRHNPMSHKGLSIPLRARLYCSTLAQEKDPTTLAVLRTVTRGLEDMDRAGRVAWNETGRLIWRVAQDASSG